MVKNIMGTLESGISLSITAGMAGAVLDATRSSFKQPTKKKVREYMSFHHF